MFGNDNITLRAVEPEDLEFLYSCENNTKIWRYGSTTAPYSRFALKQYIADAQNDIYTNKQLRLIICTRLNPQKAIGAVDLFDFDPFHQRASVGIVIDGQENQRHGYAEQSLQLIAEYCFTFLNLHQLHCAIAANNEPSIRLFGKLGFIQCGQRIDWIKTENGFIDELEFQLIAPSSRPKQKE